jgi:predicted nucleotide-binding protein
MARRGRGDAPIYAGAREEAGTEAEGYTPVARSIIPRGGRYKTEWAANGRLGGRIAVTSLTRAQGELLKTLVAMLRTSDYSEFFLAAESGGPILVHPDISDDLRLPEGDLVALADAGLVRLLPTPSPHRCFNMTQRGIEYADMLTSGRIEGGAVQTTLAVSVSEARQGIRDQIQRARELLAEPITEPTPSLPGSGRPDQYSVARITHLDEMRVRWYRFVGTMLHRYFSDASQANDFQTSATGAVHESEHANIGRWVTGIHTQLNNGINFLESLDERLHLFVKSDAATPPATATPHGRKVFVVHGHDNEAKETVARVLLKLNLGPIILAEQPNLGRVLLQKFTDHAADVGFAVILLTPDDYGATRATVESATKLSKADLEHRARQNVVFEMGFFMGAFKPERVCVLFKPGTAKPSDIEGLVYIEMDAAGAWRFTVAREIKASGLAVDLNDLA